MKETREVRRMRKLYIHLLGILFVLPLFLSVPLESWAKGKFSFRFGGSDSIGSLLDRQNRLFIDLVEKKSDGRIKIKFFPADQLGGDIAQIEQMVANSIQLYGDVLVWYANWVKDFSIFGWGFTFRDNDHLQKFIDSPICQEMCEEFRKRFGLRILAAVPTQPRILFSKKPVFGIEDIQGIKMRVPEIETYLRVWGALGTRPTRVTWAEVYLALRQGVIDACEGPVSAAYAAKFHEPAPYVTRTDHLISTAHVTMNDRAFQGLPEDLQRVLIEAAEETVKFSRDEGERLTNEVMKKMVAEGARIIWTDTNPFRKRLDAAVKKMEEKGLWSKGLYEKVQQIK
jgi:tripartite ATP-independent transporter DctP family solute receptor